MCVYLYQHSSLALNSIDKCFVPSDSLYQLARNRKLQPSQIFQYGLPIRKGFWSTAETKEKNKRTLRNDLNIDADLPTVLLVGGGDGMGGIVDIAKSLGERLGSDSSSAAYQMVVVCGNNQKAKESLSGYDFGKGVKVIVQGFVNNMDEWMQASDALVTKAGPGTIAEASICGLPCMLFSYLYVWIVSSRVNVYLKWMRMIDPPRSPILFSQLIHVLMQLPSSALAKKKATFHLLRTRGSAPIAVIHV
jgi:1,2-diacylglycerol 3-beta-galactosyltransferase